MVSRQFPPRASAAGMPVISHHLSLAKQQVPSTVLCTMPTGTMSESSRKRASPSATAMLAFSRSVASRMKPTKYVSPVTVTGREVISIGRSVPSARSARSRPRRTNPLRSPVAR
jgi:hypothetical protein